MFNLFRKPSLSGTPVIVLGMHRSGTSCLAGSLQERGVFLDKVPEWNEHNRKGNRENVEVQGLNEAILNHSGGGWNRPPEQVSWTRSHRKTRDDILQRFSASGESYWGFKDPRTLLTLEFWLPELGDCALVGTYRHPLKTARSLNARGNMSIEDGLALWSAYNSRLLTLHAERTFPIIPFDAPPEPYEARVTEFARDVGLPNPEAASFRDENLRHQEEDLDRDLPAEYLEQYQRLNRLADYDPQD